MCRVKDDRRAQAIHEAVVTRVNAEFVDMLAVVVQGDGNSTGTGNT